MKWKPSNLLRGVRLDLRENRIDLYQSRSIELIQMNSTQRLKKKDFWTINLKIANLSRSIPLDVGKGRIVRVDSTIVDRFQWISLNLCAEKIQVRQLNASKSIAINQNRPRNRENSRQPIDRQWIHCDESQLDIEEEKIVNDEFDETESIVIRDRTSTFQTLSFNTLGTMWPTAGPRYDSTSNCIGNHFLSIFS